MISPITNPFFPEESSVITPEQKAYKNARKAIEEAARKKQSYLEDQRLYREKFKIGVVDYTISGSLPLLESILNEKPHPIHFRLSATATKGCRATMEDSHFVHETENGILVGIFDGHRGKRIASFACNFFREQCADLFSENDPVTALKNLFSRAAERIGAEEDLSLHIEGSTAVAAYIDKKTHAIYTATLGDSEASIFRWNQNIEDIDYIPLSCVRNWGSPRDLARAIKYIYAEQISSFLAITDPKNRRVNGLNVSRALGDLDITAVSSKPKITINQVYPGDFLVLGCDGLWDFLSPGEVSAVIGSYMDQPREEYNLSLGLAKAALDTGKSTDNITVITIEIIS